MMFPKVPRIVRRIISSWYGEQDAGEALLFVLQQLEEACLDHEEVFGELQLERGRTSLLRLLFGLDFSQEVRSDLLQRFLCSFCLCI